MFKPNQDQNVGSGATAIQATGNVTYGLNFTEVGELCQLLHDKNFPILRAEAKAVADECVRQFAEGLGQQIVDAARIIDANKFKDPDVQACLNDAVISVARRGQASNPEMLCKLIIERISKTTNTFKDIVIAESLQIVPKLTEQHINTLCIVHTVQSVYFQHLASLSELEIFAQDIMPIFKSDLDISETQKRHMQYTGACTYNPSQLINPYEALYSVYKTIGYESIETFTSALNSEAPIYAEMIKIYGAHKLFNISLTSVGQAIALAKLSTHMRQELDFTIWIH